MKSKFALKLSALSRSVGQANRALAFAAVLGMGGAMMAAPAAVHAQATKIGFVSTERILRDSKPAKAAQAKIEAEFKKRDDELRSEEHTSELQSLMRISYAVFCLKKKNK